MNSYEVLPRSRLRYRSFLLSLAIGALGFIGLELGVTAGVFPPPHRMTVRSIFSEKALSRVPATGASASSAAIGHVNRAIRFVASIPDGCMSESAASEFEKGHCDLFWSELLEAALYGAAPLLIFLLSFWILQRRCFDEYRRFRRAVRHGRVSFVGKVSAGPLPKRDLWSWLHAVRPLQLTHPEGGPALVFWPENQTFPAKGSELLVYSLGKRAGAKRYVAKIHLPHIAVVRGGR